MQTTKPFDLLIIGGGVNGAGIARDAAGRGLSVLLVEQADLASATSSASSKLIHGGLRYLEHYEFRLVREALAEREVLLSIAPHISWPLTFVLPHSPAMRPAWMIRAGLFLYDHLARRVSLPGSKSIDLTRHPAGSPLAPTFTRGFTYADAWVDDSRLVVLNAVDAAERGAVIRTRTRATFLRRDAGRWLADVDGAGGRDTVAARILVNAGGPWVDLLRRELAGANAPSRVRLVKGSHIVVPRLYVGPHAYILQQPDRRVVFLLPFADDFTLIGTTDVPYDDVPGPVAISDAETVYLCEAASRFLRSPVHPQHVVWSYAGLRPLQDDDDTDPSAVTRDYALEVDADSDGQAPMLSVIGGKITTYRRLSEHAVDKLAPWSPGLPRAWTAATPLPGGDLGPGGFDTFLVGVCDRWPWLPSDTARRLARAYGTRIERILGDARSLADLGSDCGHGLSQREVVYLKATEFAQTADDVLWRRSKLGLKRDPFMAERVSAILRRA
jgi:glycerol-3-phosphate dehydrogenase